MVVPQYEAMTQRTRNRVWSKVKKSVATLGLVATSLTIGLYCGQTTNVQRDYKNIQTLNVGEIERITTTNGLGKSQTYIKHEDSTRFIPQHQFMDYVQDQQEQELESLQNRQEQQRETLDSILSQ